METKTFYRFSDQGTLVSYGANGQPCNQVLLSTVVWSRTHKYIALANEELETENKLN